MVCATRGGRACCSAPAPTSSYGSCARRSPRTPRSSRLSRSSTGRRPTRIRRSRARPSCAPSSWSDSMRRSVLSSASSLCHLGEDIERRGVCQRVPAGRALGIGPQQDLLHRDLELLPGQRPGHLGDLDDVVGNVAGGGPPPPPAPGPAPPPRV